MGLKYCTINWTQELFYPKRPEFECIALALFRSTVAVLVLVTSLRQKHFNC